MTISTLDHRVLPPPPAIDNCALASEVKSVKPYLHTVMRFHSVVIKHRDKCTFHILY